MISTMIVPLAVRLLPTFLLFKWMDWVNTFLPLIVPAFFGTPYFIFFVRQFYRTIPQELSDAARVDGASEFRIWWQIMVPLARPVLIAIGIFAFANVWNDFLYPLVFLTDRTKWTISIALSAMIDATGEDVQFLEPHDGRGFRFRRAHGGGLWIRAALFHAGCPHLPESRDSHLDAPF